MSTARLLVPNTRLARLIFESIVVLCLPPSLILLSAFIIATIDWTPEAISPVGFSPFRLFVATLRNQLLYTATSLVICRFGAQALGVVLLKLGHSLSSAYIWIPWKTMAACYLASAILLTRIFFQRIASSPSPVSLLRNKPSVLPHPSTHLILDCTEERYQSIDRPDSISVFGLECRTTISLSR